MTWNQGILFNSMRKQRNTFISTRFKNKEWNLVKKFHIKLWYLYCWFNDLRTIHNNIYIRQQKKFASNNFYYWTCYMCHQQLHLSCTEKKYDPMIIVDHRHKNMEITKLWSIFGMQITLYKHFIIIFDIMVKWLLHGHYYWTLKM